jgi:transposase-like protein
MESATPDLAALRPSFKLTVPVIARMSDAEVYALFCEVRWACNGGEPFCPRCGCLGVYRYDARNIFKCKGCEHQFSATSGTIFSNRKQPLRIYLIGLAVFCGAYKGVSSLEMSRHLGVSYKTAYVITQKIRSAILASVEQLKLRGIVEIDGAQFGGYRRYFNRVSQKYGKRIYTKSERNKRVLVVAKERNGRTYPLVVRKESEAKDVLQTKLDQEAIAFCDQAVAWDELCSLVDSIRINHNETFAEQHYYTNNAESFFSGMRKMHAVHGQFSPQHFPEYAGELAWKRDFAKKPLSDKVMMILSLCLCSPVSRKWKGYWQRARILRESTAMETAL